VGEETETSLTRDRAKGWISRIEARCFPPLLPGATIDGLIRPWRFAERATGIDASSDVIKI
jgi:hypothetical protein